MKLHRYPTIYCGESIFDWSKKKRLYGCQMHMMIREGIVKPIRRYKKNKEMPGKTYFTAINGIIKISYNGKI